MTNTLKGLRVLNTRPQHQAASLSKKIHEAGGIAVECPTIAIKASRTNWIQTLPDLNLIHAALFISPNAVHYALPVLRKHAISWPKKLKVIAIGQATANALKQYGISDCDMPQIADSEHLLELPSLHNITNKACLLFKGEGGRALIEDELTKQKAQVIKLIVYQRELANPSAAFVASIWRNDLVDIILATSEQSLYNLFMLFGNEGASWLQGKDYLVLSERLANCARSLGIKNCVISQPEQIINTLFDYIEDK